MRPAKKGRGKNLGGFQTPAWTYRWLMLFSTETEMKRGGLGRGGMVGARSRELRSSALNLKCLSVMDLEKFSRWLVTPQDQGNRLQNF